MSDKKSRDCLHTNRESTDCSPNYDLLIIKERHSLKSEQVQDQSIGFIRTICRVVLAIVVLGPVIFLNNDVSEFMGVILILLYGILFYVTGIIPLGNKDVYDK